MRRRRLNQQRKSKLTWTVVARRIGSNKVAVSVAMNPGGDQSPATREKILGKIDRLLSRLEKELEGKAA